MSGPVRVVVADTHSLFRAGLIALLASVPELDVLADAATATAAIELATELRPDVLVLDVEMPGPEPVTVIQKIAEASPATRVVVLTMHDDADLVRAMVEGGAVGYLLKTTGRTELVAAIISAARREGSVLLALPRATALGLGRGPKPTTTGLLSSRELQILGMVADAKSNRAIAAKLFISETTVKRHLANVYVKLRVSSRMEAAHVAAARGILPGSEVAAPTVLTGSVDAAGGELVQLCP